LLTEWEYPCHLLFLEGNLSSSYSSSFDAFFRQFLLKAFELWQKADTEMGKTSRPESFPVALDAFLLKGPAQAPTSSAVEYVEQVVGKASLVTRYK
jgi:hypothetical protein